ncbi:DUF3052 family protein [Massilia sp. PAMC28688]|uniref:DUF3052 family protein n=1 Tax=Massilia sp. PAMC28688 TaxID=2861283 RepID=UPI001C63992D|nr:DUF3052 family protein [Massilia sp. PAMC28688]QYF91678.1 DUF3052 family protein [Massilia sp. PAMC28688]
MTDKTIADKLYLKTVKSLAVFNGGVNPSVVGELPDDMLREGEEVADIVLLFALNQAELEKWWDQAMARLGDKGSLWIAYLKPTAPKATDIDRDKIFAFAAQRGVTGVAMISLDGDWSAVRLKRMAPSG